MHPGRGGLSICHNFEASDRSIALQILLKSTLEQSFIIMVYHDWVPLSVSLPPSPLPSFLFPPPFFWRGPTGFTRKHQKLPIMVMMRWTRVKKGELKGELN